MNAPIFLLCCFLVFGSHFFILLLCPSRWHSSISDGGSLRWKRGIRSAGKEHAAERTCNFLTDWYLDSVCQEIQWFNREKMRRLKNLLHCSTQDFAWQGLNTIFLLLLPKSRVCVIPPVQAMMNSTALWRFILTACSALTTLSVLLNSLDTVYFIRCTYAVFWCFCYIYLIKTNLVPFQNCSHFN